MEFSTRIPLKETDNDSILITSATYVPFHSKPGDKHYFKVSKNYYKEPDAFADRTYEKVFSKYRGIIQLDGSAVAVQFTYADLVDFVKEIVESENYVFSCSRDS